jgi:hypothetical protein
MDLCQPGMKRIQTGMPANCISFVLRPLPTAHHDPTWRPAINEGLNDTWVMERQTKAGSVQMRVTDGSVSAVWMTAKKIPVR